MDWQVAQVLTNTVLIPVLVWLAHTLWRLDRRLYRVELRLNLADE